MKPIGYYKFYRELYHKPIWKESTPEQKVILITLLGMANFKDTEWVHQGQTYQVKCGQFITSIPSIISECGKGISEQNVRTAIKRFEKLGFLIDQQMTRNKNRIITIVNWDIYQGKNDEKLTDALTDRVTDNLTDTKNAQSLDTHSISDSKNNNLTDSLTDHLTDDLNPREEVKEIKNNNMSSKPDRSYPFGEIVNYLNQKCNKNFRANTKATQLLIKARMNEGFTLEDFKQVIDTMAAEWTGKTFSNGSLGDNYLQPSTLFGAKFESYLNHKPATTAPGAPPAANTETARLILDEE